MQGTSSSKILKNYCPSTGRGQILGSFISANNNSKSFGSFRIPKSFYDEFGKYLSPNLKIMCKEITWEAEIDTKLLKICGLGTFMRFYEIKLYNLVQFDFYGNNIFVVNIFKDSGVECVYPIKDKKVFMDNEKMHTVWRKEEYVIDGWSLEFDKANALWSFNSHQNYVDYFEKKINFNDMDENHTNVSLDLDLENLYKDWKDITKVYLTFVERSWEIGIEWIGGRCYFGRGWSDFTKETKLDVGDSLVLFKEDLSRPDNVKVCIFKGKEYVIDISQGSKDCSVSFFKVLSDSSLNDCLVVVPKLIKDNYGWKLNDIRKVEVAGESSFLFYNYKRGYVSNLEKFMKYFNLKPRETVIFTMDNSNVLYARIYQVDGKEINYAGRCNGNSNYSDRTWIWNVDYDSDTESEEDSEVEKNDMGIEVAESSSKKVDSLIVRFPSFVIILDRFTMDCNDLMLPERFLLECREKIPFHVKLQMPNGRQVNVHFKKRENSLSCMSAFMKDCKNLFGSIMVYSYKGEGIFLVYVLKDDFCEVDYFEFRTIPRAPVYIQDNINGIGWKFLFSVCSTTIESGEIEIPRRFWRRFGKGVPGSVTFDLRNGKVYSGHYLHSERKFLGLLEIITSTHLEGEEFLLFTYCGDGKFEIVVFNKSNVEKMLEYNLHGSEENDVKNSEKDLLETTGRHEIIDAEMSDESEDSDTDMENVNGEAIELVEMDDLVFTFSAVMTLSNVNASSHGTYIPQYINLRNRNFNQVERVMFRFENEQWGIGIVYSNGLPRFSAGWNKFVKDNQISLNETVEFTMVEEEDELVFDIGFPGRN
ncbi:hypothetical protein POM88_033770 [Heracleum sosnowskyi]|uniref:TF-B3 domain-containing protein n=1 Tax=Heracleum sosnowskyi TaxID=360622 RepID=A0AAD8HJY0_9APIA|nr:hypothetical protein POM88_033770 [Heracleum sosnowskyi]